jgi:hypothetical protein
MLVIFGIVHIRLVVVGVFNSRIYVYYVMQSSWLNCLYQKDE